MSASSAANRTRRSGITCVAIVILRASGLCHAHSTPVSSFPWVAGNPAPSIAVDRLSCARIRTDSRPPVRIPARSVRTRNGPHVRGFACSDSRLGARRNPRPCGPRTRIRAHGFTRPNPRRYALGNPRAPAVRAHARIRARGYLDGPRSINQFQRRRFTLNCLNSSVFPTAYHRALLPPG